MVTVEAAFIHRHNVGWRGMVAAGQDSTSRGYDCRRELRLVGLRWAMYVLALSAGLLLR